MAALIGAKRQHSSGYVQIKTRRLKPGEKSGGKCWEYEHRLIMELVIGRPLERDEIVHHTDGHKDHNHPDNLELCVKRQPPGQRIVDLLYWAKEIISRYGPLEHKLDSIYYG